MVFLISLICYELFIVFTFTFFSKIKRNTGYYVFVLVALSVFLFFCYVRPLYFRDTIPYMNAYNAAQWNDLETLDFLAREPKSQMEYGFVFLMLMFKQLGLSFRAFSAWIAFISSACLFTFTKNVGRDLLEGQSIKSIINEDNYLSFFAIYLPVFGVFYNFVAIRSSLSFALLALSACMLMKKKHIRAGALFISAFCVHRLCLLGAVPLIVYSFWKKEIKRNVYLTIWLGIGIVLLLDYWTNKLMYFGAVLQTLYNLFLHGGKITPVFLTADSHGLRKLLLFLGYWANGFTLFFLDQKNEKVSKLTIIYICMMMMGLVVNGYSASYRIMDYFYMYMLPVNYVAVRKSDGNQALLKTVSLIVLVMFIVSWGYSFKLWYYDAK